MKSFPINNKNRNKNKIKIVCINLVLLSVLFCTGCGQAADNVTRTDTAMGTIIMQSLYLQKNVSQEEGQKLADQVMEEIRRLEEDTLSWRLDTAIVSLLNKSAGTEAGAQMPQELSGIMDRIWDVSRKSQGALDVTIGDVVRLWKIDDWVNQEGTSSDQMEFILPQESDLQEALEHTGFEKVTFKENRIFLPKRMKLDLGAVGKGIACEKIAQYLKDKKEVTGAVVSVGGSILTLGSKADGSLWNVGIVHPRKDGEYLGTLEIEGGWFVSTSGDYERYAEVDGVRYHHIIDPSDGYPADSGVIGVTILSRDGMLSDALSTACFVLGTEKGLTLAEEMGAEALFVDKDEKISMTEGMKEYFNGGYGTAACVTFINVVK